MASRVLCTQGDTGGSFVVALLTSGMATPVDLSAASSITLQFMELGSTTVLDTLTGVLQPGTINAQGQALGGYATAGTGGLVKFTFNPTTLDVTPGVYLGLIQVTYGGITQAAPQPVYFVVQAA